MPHCGIFTKPEAAEVVTYYRKSGKASLSQSLSLFLSLPRSHCHLLNNKVIDILKEINKLDSLCLVHIAIY